MGRKGRGDPGRHEAGPGRGRERHDDRSDERQDGEIGYKDRVHERLDRMDQRLESLEKRLERHLEGGEA